MSVVSKEGLDVKMMGRAKNIILRTIRRGSSFVTRYIGFFRSIAQQERVAPKEKWTRESVIGCALDRISDRAYGGNSFVTKYIGFFKALYNKQG